MSKLGIPGKKVDAWKCSKQKKQYNENIKK
jgi:hypothetical protein